MAVDRGSARLVYALSCLVSLLIVVFAGVVFVQHRWSHQLQAKYDQNRRNIETLQTQCVEKLLHEALSSRQVAGSKKRQTGTLEQMMKEMMAAQEKVLLSHCLNSTALCDYGQKGALGLKGNIGPAGLGGQKGHMGARGPKGDTGNLGIAGVKGVAGLPGDQGANGTQGLQGLRGPKGDNGTAGVTGLAGKTGPVGAKGDKGDHGLTGPAGLKGLPGARGQKGAKGTRGPAGVKGDAGPTGPRGPTGDVLQKDCKCIRKPVIDVFQPSHETVTMPIGSTFNLTCDSTSTPKPTITWFLAADNCTGSSPNVTGTRLNVTNLQPTQLGEYRCEATNQYGTASKTFTVKSNLVGALDCDFETTCIWENDHTDIGDWVLRHGPTGTANTGPSVDHTLGTSRGYYMYTDSPSISSRRGNRVHLRSPELPGSGPACLSFWYHMYGSQEGSLRVETEDDCSRNHRLLRDFTTTGNHSDLWHPANIQLPTTAGKHTLVITSVQGSGIRSDVAIDDIKYYDGQCTPIMSRLGPSVRNLTVSVGDRVDLDCGIEGTPTPSYAWQSSDSCVSNTQATGARLHVTNYASSGTEGVYICNATEPGQPALTTTYNVKVTGTDGTCDLEHGLCGWTQDKTDIFDWNILSGPTDSQETGPPNDHTRNSSSGRYLYIEASSPRTVGHYAVMRSPLIEGKQDACFSLYYNMYGVDMGNLTVMIEDKCTKQTTDLFTTSGNKGQKWLFKEVNISSSAVPHDYNILVKGTIGSSFHGDLAIDDLRITNAPCGAFSDLEFDCTFEKGTCKWVQATNDKFDWTRIRGPSPSTGTGPNQDHTSGSGYYLYTEASSQSPGQDADLVSPVVPSGKDYCFHFYTSMYGTGMGHVTVMAKEEGLGGRQSTISTISKATNNAWVKHDIHITPHSMPFRIVVKGVIGLNFSSDIAIDDVSLTEGSC